MTILGIRYQNETKGHPLEKEIDRYTEQLRLQSREEFLWVDEARSNKLSDAKYTIVFGRGDPKLGEKIPDHIPIIFNSFDVRYRFSSPRDQYWIGKCQVFMSNSSYNFTPLINKPSVFAPPMCYPEDYRENTWYNGILSRMSNYGDRDIRLLEFLKKTSDEFKFDLIGQQWGKYEDHPKINLILRSHWTSYKDVDKNNYKFNLEVMPKVYDFMENSDCFYWSDRTPMALEQGNLIITNNEPLIRYGLPAVISFDDYLNNNYSVEWEMVQRSRELLEPDRWIPQVLKDIDQALETSNQVFW